MGNKGKVKKAYRNRRDPTKRQWNQPKDYKRRMEPVPGHATQLFGGDTIWLGIRDENDMNVGNFEKALQALGLVEALKDGGTFNPMELQVLAGNQSRTSLFRVMPTFLSFEVPQH